MSLLNVLVYISSISFLAYGISYFITPHMKSEFKRFKLEKYGVIIAILELTGAIGLIVGFRLNAILLIASGGLAILMFLGFLVRLRIKDSLWVSLPVLFYLVLNSYIFFQSMQFFLG